MLLNSCMLPDFRKRARVFDIEEAGRVSTALRTYFLSCLHLKGPSKEMNVATGRFYFQEFQGGTVTHTYHPLKAIAISGIHWVLPVGKLYYAPLRNKVDAF